MRPSENRTPQALKKMSPWVERCFVPRLAKPGTQSHIGSGQVYRNIDCILDHLLSHLITGRSQDALWELWPWKSRGRAGTHSLVSSAASLKLPWSFMRVQYVSQAWRQWRFPSPCTPPPASAAVPPPPSAWPASPPSAPLLHAPGEVPGVWLFWADDPVHPVVRFTGWMNNEAEDCFSIKLFASKGLKHASLWSNIWSSVPVFKRICHCS